MSQKQWQSDELARQFLAQAGFPIEGPGMLEGNQHAWRVRQDAARKLADVLAEAHNAGQIPPVNEELVTYLIRYAYSNQDATHSMMYTYPVALTVAQAHTRWYTAEEQAQILDILRQSSPLPINSGYEGGYESAWNEVWRDIGSMLSGFFRWIFRLK